MLEPVHRPLAGIRVVDFSTLIPGPIATLLLAEAGATVIKIERKGDGDDLRGFAPRLGGDSWQFAMLNRGKQSLFLDLKAPADRDTALALIDGADIVVEQFRPGVMARLGLGYEAVAERNPRIIYCSITGYGQSGVRAQKAGHDINYLAETGVLSLVADAAGRPMLPPVAMADLGGGTYPALLNILLALIERGASGRGRHLDIAMADNVFPLLSWALAETAAGAPPQPSQSLITGASPRYAIYPTRDGQHIAAAPLEDKFWRTFCALVGIAEDADTEAVGAAMRARDAAEWLAVFARHDVCCSLVRSVEEAMADPDFAARGVFDHIVGSPAGEVPALPTPLVAAFRDPEASRPMPVRTSTP